MNKGYYLEKVKTIKSTISELTSQLKKLEQECLTNCAKYKVGETIVLNFDDEYDYGTCEIIVTILSVHINENLEIRYLVKVDDSIDTLLCYEDYIDDNKIII